MTVAEVAELADAHGSGPCTRKGVGVRVPPSAPKDLNVMKEEKRSHALLFFIDPALRGVRDASLE